MPRRPHGHGGGVHARGIPDPEVCVVCGASDAGDEFCRPADRGRPTDDAPMGTIGDLGAGTWVATDAHRGHGRVLPALGFAEHAATDSRQQRDGELGMADALHQRLRIFHGVSTRLLDHHPSWFVWLEQARRSDADRLRSLSGQAAAGSYENTRRQMIERLQPFWGYWGRKGLRQWRSYRETQKVAQRIGLEKLPIGKISGPVKSC